MARVLYWLAVVAVSLALVVGLILWLEARDKPSLGDSGGVGNPSPSWIREG